MSHPLDPLFSPKSVAMVGATAAAQKIAGRRWKTLVEGGFAGPVYPIHPSAAEVRGHTAYRSLRDVPGDVDLAVIVVPPQVVPEIARDCAEKGVGAVVVISGGFAESGEEGRTREAELLALMRAAGIRMIGPNCAGIASMPAAVNVTGCEVPAGRIGLISQSGNIALNLSFLAQRTGGGFSRQITIGNAADLGVAELLDYLLQDPDTDVVLIYLEGWRDGEGRRLVDIVRAAGGAKPIVMLNPGGTETGRRAALSHTGALAAAHRIAAGAYRQTGIIQVDDVEAAWALATSLSALPPMTTANVCVLSDGGGHATLICDALDRAGLNVPAFGAATQERLAGLLPPRCAIANPVDFAGVAETEPPEMAPVLDACLADPEISGAVLVGHFGGYHLIGGEAVLPLEIAAAEAMADVFRRHGKPLLVHSVHGNESLPALDRLRAAGAPVLASIPSLAGVAGGLWRAASRPEYHTTAPLPVAAAEDEIAALLARAAPGPPRWLMEPEARALLALCGIAVPDYALATTADECAAVMAFFGGPVAMKRIAPDLVHKSRQGGVRLNVAGADEARAAFHALTAGAGDETRILLAPMIGDGIELVIGGVCDRHFGPVVMVGLGGVHVEALDDVTFRPAPVAADEARAMLRDVRGYGMLATEREPALAAIADLLARVSALLAARPEIAEIDLNPIFVGAAGAAIADARIVLL